MSHGLLDAQRRVWATQELEPLEKLTLLALLSHWSRQSQSPFPSVSRLEALTGMARHTVLRAIRNLESKGWLGVTKRKGARSTYDLGPLFAKPVQRVHQSEGSGDDSTGAADAPVSTGETSAADAPVNAKPNAELVQEVHRTGAADAPELVQQMHPNRSNKRSKKGSRETRARKPQRQKWTRVPSDWEPKDEHRAIAAERGLDFANELAMFRDHEYARPKVDPDATFRVWLRASWKQPRPAKGFVPQRNGTIRERPLDEVFGQEDRIPW